MPTLLVPRVLFCSAAKLRLEPPRTGATTFMRDALGIGRCLALLVASLAWAPAVQAQESTDVAAPAPAHVAYVDGTVTLERDGALDVATVNMPIVAGDRLRTTLGRIELLFPDGTALDLDESSS